MVTIVAIIMYLPLTSPFSFDYDSCFDAALSILKHIDKDIRNNDRNLIKIEESDKSLGK